MGRIEAVAKLIVVICLLMIVSGIFGLQSELANSANNMR